MEQSLTEAIILAGGLGTRLRSAVPDLPKCMAPVNGKPFIAWVIDHLQQQGIKHFIFALGYKHEAFIDLLNAYFPGGNYSISVEEEPLGTGGAIQFACSKTRTNQVVVTNGDTLFRVNLTELASFHAQKTSECTLALKPMKNFSRYGAVELSATDVVIQFKEKKYFPEGLINGGVYVLDKNSLLSKKLPAKFSFEKDFLEVFYKQSNIYGIVQDAYFIDIGVPEDYERAQEELPVL